MGITTDSLNRLNKHNMQPPASILMLGCQNLYSADEYYTVAHGWYEKQGYTVRSWDILGCQGSEVVDLREDLQLQPEYDWILQHGTVEHCDGELYQVFKNIHDCCKIGAIMVHENPMHLNWPGHGYHYFTEQFYYELGYEVLEVTQEAAMGNTVDGWNICAVLRKTFDTFLSKEDFDKLYNKTVFKS